MIIETRWQIDRALSIVAGVVLAEGSQRVMSRPRERASSTAAALNHAFRFDLEAAQRPHLTLR